MAEFTTILKDVALQLRLGIHPQEATPQRVLVSIWLTIDYPVAPVADRIDEVLDYDRVRDGILALAEGDGFDLQETLVERVAALCLADARVTQVRVRSMKPDIYPEAAVGCEIVRMR